MMKSPQGREAITHGEEEERKYPGSVEGYGTV